MKIAGGTIEGAVADGVSSFKGIPFAEPPVGDLRWRPPQPVKPWTGVKTTTEYGHDCAQLPFPGDAAPLGHAARGGLPRAQRLAAGPTRRRRSCP